MSLNILKSIFNYNSFRIGQEEIIKHIQEGKDILVLMPTGAGKSLCFQLPAVMANGVTVVISPLISLIYDQVTALRELGVCAYYLNSTTSANDKRELMSSLQLQTDEPEGKPYCKCKLLYTTPEAITNNYEFQEKLDEIYENCLLEGFVIDEAHCVSNWGHDFRHSYLELNVIKEYYPLIPIWAFTATATKKVQYDIISQLKLQECKIFSNSFIRKNLSYQIFERVGDINLKVASLLKNEFAGQSGLVYCLRRADCEELSQYLCSKGIASNYYHAKIDSSIKETVQNDWLSGKIKVIVATIAFALGINKPDVRFVIHTAMPASIESYYQETGRAGRDTKHSTCILFYSYQDKVILEKLSNKDNLSSGNAPTSNKSRINAMYSLCQNRYDCIKMQMSHYLGEYLDYSCGVPPPHDDRVPPPHDDRVPPPHDRGDNACRNCAEKIKYEMVDFTTVAKDIISMVKSNNSIDKAVLAINISNKYSTYSYSDIVRVINKLLVNGNLKTTVFKTDVGINEGVKLCKDKELEPLLLKYNTNTVMSMIKTKNQRINMKPHSQSHSQIPASVITAPDFSKSLFEDESIKMLIKSFKT
jgi:RecQ family ATP-dependent DNA helicase